MERGSKGRGKFRQPSVAATGDFGKSGDAKPTDVYQKDATESTQPASSMGKKTHRKKRPTASTAAEGAPEREQAEQTVTQPSAPVAVETGAVGGRNTEDLEPAADADGAQTEASAGKKNRRKKKPPTSTAAEGAPEREQAESRSSPGSASNGNNGRKAACTPGARQLTVKLAPPRDPGKKGRPLKIVSNCWNVTLKPMTVYMYDIEVLHVYRMDESRLVELRCTPREKRDILHILIPRFPSGILFDGGRIIYSDKPLPGLDSDIKQDEAEFDDPISLEKRKVKYVVKHTGTRNTADIVNFMEGSNGDSICTIQDCLRVLDCASKLACNGPFVCLGRMAIFDKSAVKTIANKLLSIHRGFVLTVRPQWKLRINIDMTFTAMFPSGNLADILYEKYGDQMCPKHRQISRDIMGLRMLSPKIYRKNPGDEPHARLFTAHDVSEKSATQIIIPDTKQSVQQYFESTYGVKLKYPYLPCIKVKKDREVFYPMELLEVLPFQKPRANPDLAAEIIRCAAVRPGDRFGELAKFCRSLISQPGLQRYGMKIDPTMQEVNAREIDPPRANFGGSFEQLGRGKWQANRFYLPANANGLIRLIVVTTPPYRGDANDRQQLVANLTREGASRNLRFQLLDSFSLRPEMVTQKMHQFQNQVDLVLFVLDGRDDYSQIKVLSDLTLGVRTQCVCRNTLGKRGFIGNLLLKINAKLDGKNWILEPFAENAGIMVLGADVTHPSGTSPLQQSLGAVTGSISNDLVHYRAIVFQQQTKRPQQTSINEVIDNIKVYVLELLKEYHRRNNCPPKKLIFYRDGVSEGQFEQVLLEELSGIQKACHEFRQGLEIPITFIVVQKRHHVRLKPATAPVNVNPGTVVDTEITSKSEFDFYLCSQEGIQGTSRPAHYRILYDDNNYSADELQAFTFALCHIYMRCTRSVSYPAPTYYSHLAAFRARDWLGCNPNRNQIIQNGQFRIHQNQICSLFFC